MDKILNKVKASPGGITKRDLKKSFSRKYRESSFEADFSVLLRNREIQFNKNKITLNKNKNKITSGNSLGNFSYIPGKVLSDFHVGDTVRVNFNYKYKNLLGKIGTVAGLGFTFVYVKNDDIFNDIFNQKNNQKNNGSLFFDPRELDIQIQVRSTSDAFQAALERAYAAQQAPVQGSASNTVTLLPKPSPKPSVRTPGTEVVVNGTYADYNLHGRIGVVQEGGRTFIKVSLINNPLRTRSYLLFYESELSLYQPLN